MRVQAKGQVHDHILDDFDNQNLTPGKIYAVIGVEAEDFRVLDDACDPILYPKCLFDVIDPHIPDTWVRRDIPPNEYFVNPVEMSERAFWDRFHEGDPEARALFQQYLDRVSNIGD